MKWQCNNCNIIISKDEWLTAPSPFDPDEMLTACPRCRQCVDGFALLCDEPGCTRPATCGWPTGAADDEWGGYRHSCGDHDLSGPGEGRVPLK